MSKLRGMMLGAMAGSLIASTFALFGTRQMLLKKIKYQAQDWVDKAKNVKENVFDNMRELTESKRNRLRKTFIGGAALGLLIGIGSAVLLTPKTGKQLRKDLTQKYQGMANKTQNIMDLIHQNGYRKPLRKLSRVLSKRRHVAKNHQG